MGPIKLYGQLVGAKIEWNTTYTINYSDMSVRATALIPILPDETTVYHA
jgi:hypothetical protein